MNRFRKCLAIINTRSGAREGLSVFASALQQYLDKAGIIHHDFCVPERNISSVLCHQPGGSVDAVIVCGGDGTLCSVANVIATTPDHPFTRVPIVPVPCGLQNSISASLGVYSAERSVSAFVLGRVEPVQVWEILVNGIVARYVLSYIAIGTYAMCVERLHKLDAVGDNYFALPMVRNKFKLGTLYTVMRDETVPCTVRIKHKSKVPGAEEALLVVKAPIKMLIASQMPFQHRHYTITPEATFKHGTLSVTYATSEATRLRMWHLLSREALEGVILNEDGVCECTGATEVELVVEQETAGGGPGPFDALMMLDGEPMRLLPGTRVTIRRAQLHLLITSC
ncbi:Diacylglycerol kinase catalytic domain [Trypanosoma vivax]|uniref:DAGKc domain-containing protein n=1 Tax=Trypanosoma vivax (strain Y486) TaxID=1055687 RepID=G0TWJ9_TRYVY|nr:hypothetical protein TRVL_08614 [Trypanosoma vivax]KAH8608810.1 Diacylglycerol kinase catalytic domain [Trypanosoma vivax]CCC48337.1 conserved hypothetical protein [Trypanosoma vivax Y486]